MALTTGTPRDQSPPLPSSDRAFLEQAVLTPADGTTYVPLDDHWHQDHAPVLPPRETARPKPPSAPPAVRTVHTPSQPRMVVTRTDAAPTVPAEAEDDEAAEDGWIDPDVRVHTPLTKLGTTCVHLALVVVSWYLWLLSARYTIATANGLGTWLHRDVTAWNTHGFFLFEWIGGLGGWLPLLGGIFRPLKTLPVIWCLPLVITIGEAVLWPRRRRLWKDLVFFWKPLKHEASWKHYVFLAFLGSDVFATCVGAVIEQTRPGGTTSVTSFDISILQQATSTQIAVGIGFGIFCAVASERLASFSFRDTIGLWFPPDHRIHRIFKPSSYVQYV